MTKHPSQSDKAKSLYQLHHTGKLLILPNIWDVIGAKLLADLGYTAIATASASVAISNGYPDGEVIPFEDVVKNLTRIAGSVHVPVTADIESAYAYDDTQLDLHIRKLIGTGIVGINFEDTNHRSKTLNDMAIQCDRIKIIRKAANEMDVPLFINARTDVLLNPELYPTPEIKLDELIKRGLAYKEAGADCFFPVMLKNEEDIAMLTTVLQMPVNIIAVPGIPELKILEELGVARLSLGPSFLRTAIKAMKSLAMDLMEQKGLSTIVGNEVTTDYLKSLVKQ